MTASIVAPVFIFVNPITAVVTLLVNFHIFRFFIPRFQLNPEIVLSNHTNALVITFFAIFLSIIVYQYAVKNLQQEQYIRKQKEALEYLAHTDPLTDLMNRRRFIQLVKLRQDHGIIAVVDIDDFKKINDQYGHPVGDEILKQFSNLMIDYFEVDDLIARFGGEEFLILMRDMAPNDAHNILEHFRKYVEEKPFIVDDSIIRFTISTGYTCKDNGKNSFYTAYKLADKALYKAKENGKNVVLHN